MHEHTAEALDRVAGGGGPMVITRDGAAAVVVMDMAEFEGMRESLLLTKILAMGMEDVAKGDTVALDVVERRFEARFEAAG